MKIKILIISIIVIIACFVYTVISYEDVVTNLQNQIYDLLKEVSAREKAMDAIGN